MKDNKIPLFIFAFGCLLFVIFYTFIAPQHAGTDFFIFKDTGANLSFGKGFMSITTPDNPTFHPKLYATYTPLYAFIYGLYTIVFGYGAYENTYFNLLLKILWSGTLLWFTLKFFSTKLSTQYKLIFAFCCVLLIPVSGTNDRPEDLILFFIFLSFLSFYSEKKYKILLTFLFIGANFTTSPFGGFVNLLLVIVILLYQYQLTITRFLKKRHLIEAVLGIGAIPAIWILTYIDQDPDAFSRLFVVGTQKAGLSVFLGFISTGDISYYISSFMRITGSGRFFGITFAIGFIISHIVPIIFFAIRFLLTRQKLALLFSGIFGAIFIGTIILFPFQYNYMWLLTLPAITLFLIILAEEKTLTRFLYLPISLLVLITVINQPRIIRDIYARSIFLESYKQAMQESAKLRENISDKWVSINPLQYFTIKPYAKVGSSTYCSSPEKYDFVAVGYRDLKTGEMAYPTWFIEKNYDLVYKPDISKYVPKTRLDEIMLRPSDIWQFALYKKRQ